MIGFQFMKWIIIILIILTILLVVFDRNLRSFQKDQPESLGRILSLRGQVMGQAGDEESFKNLDLNSPLLQSQKIRTGFDSQVLMEFGDQFLLKEESLIFLLKLGTQYQVQLLSGEIRRYSKDKSTRFLVDNRMIHENLIQVPVKKEFSPKKDKVFKQQTSVKTTPEPKIQNLLTKTFKLHQPFMEKCFIKHYERKKGQTQSGHVLLSFYIEKTGRLSEVTLKKSDYQDADLHLCLKEVASRVQIKNYRDSRIRVDFPIEIKLPSI